VNSGATWLDRDLVKDGNLVTSRGPQDMASFVPAILDHFAETAPEAPAAEPGQVSDPQLDAPVGWAVAAAALGSQDIHTGRPCRSDGRCAPVTEITTAKSLLLSQPGRVSLGAGHPGERRDVYDFTFFARPPTTGASRSPVR
jgi:DJ-1/PfpI family